MSKYIWRKPPGELEIDPDFYAFDSHSDYLSYIISDFSSPESFMAHRHIETLRRDDEVQYTTDVYGRNWTSYHPSRIISEEEFDRDYDKALSQQDPYLEMFENYVRDAAAPFTNFEEFMEYMTDVYGKDWSSDVPSTTLNNEDPFKDYEEAFYEMEAEDTLWLIHDQRIVIDYLYGASTEEYEYAECYFEQLQRAHNSAKARRYKRRVDTIRMRTKLVKQFMPGSNCWHKYQQARSLMDNYSQGGLILDHYSSISKNRIIIFDGGNIPPILVAQSCNIIRKFRYSVKIAGYYEGYFLYTGRFIKYNPAISSNPILQELSDQEADEDTAPSRSTLQETLHPFHKKDKNYLPKKKSKLHKSCSKAVKKTPSDLSPAVSTQNQMPKLCQMPVHLRHFINS